MQEAYNFLVKMLAGVANFLRALILDVRESVILEVKSNAQAIIDSLSGKLSDTVDSVVKVANQVAELAKAADGRLSEIQQANKDALDKTNEQIGNLGSQAKEYFSQTQANVGSVDEKLKALIEKTDAQVDAKEVEDTFYKYLHEDIAKAIQAA